MSKTQKDATAGSAAAAYNFAYLDEQTKRMIRRVLLKAVAIPWLPGAVRRAGDAAALRLGHRRHPGDGRHPGPGRHAEGHRPGRRRHHQRRQHPPLLRRHRQRAARRRKRPRPSIIQTRHRIPEEPLGEGQILVYQVPNPEPLRKLEPRVVESRKMHAYAEYGLMQVKLYEDISRFGDISVTYDYPVLTNGRYVMAPSPIPKFDNPKMHDMPALQLFGAGREKRIYAIPPYTSVKSLDFDDYPFRPQEWEDVCGLCGADDSFLDEVILDDKGGHMFVCSDSDYCGKRRAAGHVGPMADDAAEAGYGSE